METRVAKRDSESLESALVTARVDQFDAENAQENYADIIASEDTDSDEHRSISEANRVTSLINSLKAQMKLTNYIDTQEFQISVYYLIDAVSRLTVFNKYNEIILDANTFIRTLPKDMTTAANSVLKSTVGSIGARVRARAEAKRARTGGGHYKLKRYSKTRRRYGKARRTRKTR
jgi:hypothetical protein